MSHGAGEPSGHAVDCFITHGCVIGVTKNTDLFDVSYRDTLPSQVIVLHELVQCDNEEDGTDDVPLNHSARKIELF